MNQRSIIYWYQRSIDYIWIEQTDGVPMKPETSRWDQMNKLASVEAGRTQKARSSGYPKPMGRTLCGLIDPPGIKVKSLSSGVANANSSKISAAISFTRSQSIEALCITPHLFQYLLCLFIITRDWWFGSRHAETDSSTKRIGERIEARSNAYS